MAKIIKMNETDLKKIVKKVINEMEIPDDVDPEHQGWGFEHKYDQSAEHHMFKPTWMYMYVGGKGFEITVDYEITNDENDDDDFSVTFRYYPMLDELEYEDDGQDVDEHLVAMIKQDFIKRFGISKKGMGHAFRLSGNIEINGKFMDWKAHPAD